MRRKLIFPIGLIIVIVLLSGPAPAQEPERFFVILGSHAKADAAGAQTRVDKLNAKGWDAYIIDTDLYGNLKNGLWAVVLGPYDQARADRTRNSVRALVPDAYVKAGWNPTPTQSVAGPAKWLVVAGSFGHSDQAGARRRADKLNAAGLKAYIVDTGDVPNFRDGFLAVVVGPFANRREAGAMEARVRTVVPDAYVKAGW